MTLVNTPTFNSQYLNLLQEVCQDDIVNILNGHTDWISLMSNHTARTITGSTTLNEFDRYIVYRGSSDATITLPPIADIDPKQNIRIVNQTEFAVRVRGSGGETINFPYANQTLNSPRPVLRFFNDTIDLFPITANNWTEIPVFENNARAHMSGDVTGNVTLTPNATNDIIFGSFLGSVPNNYYTGGVYTVPINGLYHITLSIQVNVDSADAIVQPQVYKNGGLLARSSTLEPNDVGVYRGQVTKYTTLFAGDQIDFKVALTNTGGTLIGEIFSTFGEISLISRT